MKLKMPPNPYKVFEGMSLYKRDVELWQHDRFMDFFRFVGHFMIGDRVKPTKAARREVEEITIQVEAHPWLEFMTRINLPTSIARATDSRFYNKLASMIRVVGGVLKENPVLVTEEIRALIKDNPRLNWALVHFKEVELSNGQTTVLKDTSDGSGGVVPVATPQMALLETQLKIASVGAMIVNSIKASEIKDMDIKDRINALAKLLPIYKSFNGNQGNTNVFNKINIIKATREDLESSLLGFNQNENGNEGS